MKDPWKTESVTSENEGAEGGKESPMRFEDNFVSANNQDEIIRLPDSAEYISSLEKKLEKLKSGKKGNKDLVRSLEEKHKSCMERLVSDSNKVSDDDDFILDTPVSRNHPLFRYVAPDKQALTLGELVELLKADHLSQHSDELNTEISSAESQTATGTTDSADNDGDASSVVANNP